MEPKKNKTWVVVAIIILGIIAFLIPNQIAAQTGIKRTDLQRHDLSIPGHETLQARIDFEAHSAFGKHSHPGEEVIYVLEGSLEYEIEGQAPVTLKAGEVLFIPAGVIHSARNNSDAKASELATYGKEAAILPFPLQTTFMSPLRKAALDQQKWDMILFWGGQIAPILKHTKATELMQALITETTAYFDDLKV